VAKPGILLVAATISSVMRFIFLLLLGLAVQHVQARTPEVEGDYISRLRQSVAEWQREIPALDASTAQAAESLVAGGRLYLAGTQQSFVKEGIGRSGGLFLCQRLTDQIQLQPKDVVLFGAIHDDDPAVLDALRRRVDASRASLVIFSSSLRLTGPHVTQFPGRPPADEAFPRVESTSNVAGLWAWCGQLITHCVAVGKMPCIYESLTMPGGVARDKLLKGVAFHTENVATAGSRFPALGCAYLEALDLALERLLERNGRRFDQAAAILEESHSAGVPVVVFSLGHMFPEEFASNSMPSWITPAAAKSLPTAGSLPLYLGYQWFPWDIPLLTGPSRIPSIIVSSRHPTPDWPADASHIYLDPCWDVQDAAVDVPGYDVKALPTSGVLESAIFWEILEKLPKPVRNP
jgi:uncharacterized phosphosugar-binding protein